MDPTSSNYLNPLELQLLLTNDKQLALNQLQQALPTGAHRAFNTLQRSTRLVKSAPLTFFSANDKHAG